QPGHAAADRLQARRQLRAAPIDRRLVRRRRLEPHERVDSVEEPLTLGATVVAEAYNRVHDPHKDTQERTAEREDGSAAAHPPPPAASSPVSLVLPWVLWRGRRRPPPTTPTRPPARPSRRAPRSRHRLHRHLRRRAPRRRPRPRRRQRKPRSAFPFSPAHSSS